MKIGSLKILSARIALVLCISFTAQSTVQANTTDAELFKQTPASVHYDNALALIQAASYKEALTTLRRVQANFPGFEKIAGVQTRIAVLSESDDAIFEIGYYLEALDMRDAGDAEGALASLEVLLEEFPGSTLADDALYLTAYIQTMDRYDFSSAQATLATLEDEYPGSSYQDSAEYLYAITYEQMGQTEQARVMLETLRERHTAFTLPFGYSVPQSTVISRYWYDRADRRLDIINQADSTASLLRSKTTMDTGELSVTVNVDGVDLNLKLSASPLILDTEWRDGQLNDQSPPVAGVFIGTVEGDDDSWVRAVIVDDTISGAAFAHGTNFTMQTGTLIGTLDYYKPRSAINRAAGVTDAVSKEADVNHDGLTPPPALGSALGGRSSTLSHSDLRVVPMSIVVDAEFDRYHGGNGLVVALNQLNVADGIYRQFGLALAVDEVQVFGANDRNPLKTGPSSLESYLLDFRGYRQDKRAFFSDSVLTYLFTGKQRTDSTLGLAWIDTLCRTDGYDVGITTPSAIGEVLLTHELGHSLGSQHDSDTSCNQETTKIMWPNISTRTQPVFSSCSSNSVSHAHSKSCLVNAVDVSLNAIGTDTGVEFIIANLDSTVSVKTALTIETSSVDLLSLPAGCNQLTPTSINCTVGELLAAEERRISFPVSAALSGSGELVTGALSTIATTDFNPVDNVITYSIDTGSLSTEHLILASNNTSNIHSTSDVSSIPTESAAGSVSHSGLLMLSLVQIISAFSSFTRSN